MVQYLRVERYVSWNSDLDYPAFLVSLKEILVRGSFESAAFFEDEVQMGL